VSHAHKSRLGTSDRRSGGKHASREGAVGNIEAVRSQVQVVGAAGDRKNTGGSCGEEEAQSPNIIGTVKQVLGLKAKPGEVKQSSDGRRGGQI